ncbi:MAG: DNA-binding transcriptional regulator BolA [Hyphomicrobiaceae bacterium hypho_1]
MPLEIKIQNKLITGLNPIHLKIINESQIHSGHSSSPGTGQSHFRVIVVAKLFCGLSRLQRHRMINKLLANELSNEIHALTVNAYAPDEYQKV